MPERHERVLVRWHCAKVKGHAELKIEKPRVKTLSYDFPKSHHSKTNSFCVTNVHLRQNLWKTAKVTKRSCDVTPRSMYQKSKGHPWSPCASNLVQFRLLFTKLRHFGKKWHMSFFFDRPPSWKCQSNHTGFQTYPSPKWKMADPRNFGLIWAFFSELSC